MKIRSKIFAIVGVLGVATVVVCGMGLYAMSDRPAKSWTAPRATTNFVSELMIKAHITDVALKYPRHVDGC